MPRSTLSAQGIIKRAFNESNLQLRATHVGTASAYTRPADLSIQGILQRCFEESTGELRTVAVS